MWQHSSSGCSLPGTRPSINHSSSISAVFAGARSSSGRLFGSYKWRQTVQINKNQQGTQKHSGLKKVLEESFHRDSRKVMVLIILFPKEFSEILLSLLLISTVSCCQVTPLWETSACNMPWQSYNLASTFQVICFHFNVLFSLSWFAK